MTLTKDHLAKKIADDCGFMKGEASEIIEKVLALIKERLISGEDVMISGFVPC
jgi:integration host factor subunit alpha